MDKELAKLLLPFVNDPHIMGALSIYVEQRILSHHKRMEIDDDHRQSQGAIKELRRLDTLRQEVLQTVEEARNARH